MFETSLLESSGRLRFGPGWATAASVTLQSLALGLFVLIPLLHTEALPAVRLVMAPVPVPRGMSARDTASPQPQGQKARPLPQSPIALVAPPRIPPTIVQDRYDGPPGLPPVGELGGCRGVCVPGGVPGSVTDLLQPSRPMPPEASVPQQRIVMSGGVTAGQLVHRVQPVYPRIAVLAGIEGTVVLHAIISKAGTIESLRVASGPPMLQQAAVDAVKQWRYRPFFLGNVPVEVETQVTVNFVLSRNR